MAKTNIEIYERILAAFNADGIDGVLEYFSEDVEIYDPDLPPEVPRRGHEGIRQVAEQLMSGFREVQVRNFELLSAGDRVIAVLHTFACGEGGEIELYVRDAHIVTFRGGKVVHWRLYLDPDEALADAGIDPPGGAGDSGKPAA